MLCQLTILLLQASRRAHSRQKQALRDTVDDNFNAQTPAGLAAHFKALVHWSETDGNAVETFHIYHKLSTHNNMTQQLPLIEHAGLLHELQGKIGETQCD